MAETDFILNRDEQRDMLQFLIEKGVSFVPRIRSSKNIYTETTSVNKILQLSENLMLNGPVFILSKKFTQYPLEMRCFEKDGKKMYTISPKKGGPCMDINPSREMFYRDPPLLVSGTLGYYPTYWIKGEFEIPAPKELKQLYAETKKYLSTISKRFGSIGVKRYYWIGHKALDMLREGIATNIPQLDLPFQYRHI